MNETPVKIIFVGGPHDGDTKLTTRIPDVLYRETTPNGTALYSGPSLYKNERAVYRRIEKSFTYRFTEFV